MSEDYINLMIKWYEDQYKNSGVPEICGNIRKKSEMVPMRDGVRLHTLIFLPETEKKTYPVILMRTCYPAQDTVYRSHGEQLARRGFAYVCQYSRGREKSQGEWEPNVNERNDGTDTVDWLKDQEWCGEIGYWGYSYSSLAGWAMADAVEGKVNSMFLAHYGTDRFVSAYEKGEFRHDILTSWSMENTREPIDASYPKYIESCRYRPQTEVDIKLWGQRSESYHAYITNTRITDPYWQSGWWKVLREIPGKMKIPIYMISGWYDHHHGSSMKAWENLNEESKKHSWLEIGGWNHFMEPCLQDKKTDHMDPGEIGRMLNWFCTTLIDKKAPEQKINIYRIGEDKWRQIPDWPVNGGKPERFWLEKTVGAGKKNTGRLSPDCPMKGEAFCYVYDPDDPVETVSGEGLLKTMWKTGSLLQPEPGYRDDVLSFLSDPLEKDMKICGKIRIRLFVKSDCEDTAFTAKVMEVDPEGKAYHIRSSVTTLSHELLETYNPGDEVEVSIEMWDIAYTVPSGYCIRIDISSSDFPQYNIHSNTKGLWSEQTETKKAHQTILAGGEHPSCVDIPVM